MDNRQVVLRGGKYFLSDNRMDAYRVKTGTVIIYIAPLRDDELGRRTYIYEAAPGEVIPAFTWCDAEYCQWRFCFVAIEEAALEIIENGATRLLRERFARKIGVRNYDVEGYDGGLVDYYKTNVVKEDSFIHRSQKAKVTTEERTLELIRKAFSAQRTINSEDTGEMLYDSAMAVCRKSGIAMVPFEKLKEACGDKYSIADIARLSGFSYREIVLPLGWYSKDLGNLLVFEKGEKPLACLQRGSQTYTLYDSQADMCTPVSNAVAQAIAPKAYMFYRPLPDRPIHLKDMISFCVKSVRKEDVVRLCVLTIVTALVGLLTPTISQRLYDEYIPLGAQNVLFQLGCVMASFLLANVMFNIVKNIACFRITSRVSYDAQNALYGRLFGLEESFLRQFESADLAQRVLGAGALVQSGAMTIIMSVVAIIYVIVYFARMMSFSPTLALTGFLMVAVYAVLYYLIAASAQKYRAKAAKLEGKTMSIMYQFLGGIAKIRGAGVEDRALYEYLKPYVELRNYEERVSRIDGWGNLLSVAANSIFTLVIYVLAIKGNVDVSVGAFLAFNSMFGSFAAYFMQLASGVVGIKAMIPQWERLKPVLETRPEANEAKELPGEITGEVELNNVSFSYSQDGPVVLHDISLKIKAGEYVGIVGPSGCGKSTLLKLLLGFEKPTVGKVFYNNKDIESVDKRELRKQLGVVLQNGKLISGSIYENITITAPKATARDVMEVIESVGLKKDIEEMPMGLHTVLSEDCGTISGGQQQRILIARAIISKPKLLLFDEATSALDNITQNMVCETLEKMQTTRIVIAHRLSTIMRCDRIIVMNSGRIAEQGSYEELMDKHGLFYQLASRQKI